MIISGYFLIKSEAKVHKIVNLWLQVFTYSILVYIVLVAFHQTSFSPSSFLQALLPVTYNQYWFITAYILIYIFSPFINRLLIRLSEKQFIAFIAILGYVVCIIPFFFNGRSELSRNITAMFFYVIGAYIQLFQGQHHFNRFGKPLLITGTVLMLLSVVGLNVLGRMIGSDAVIAHTTYFGNLDSPLSFMIAVGLFLTALHARPWRSRAVNYIASKVFAVYLITEEPAFRVFLWQKLLNMNKIPSGIVILGYGVMFVLAVYFLCIGVEVVRVNTLGKLLRMKEVKGDSGTILGFLTNRLITLATHKH